MSTTLSPPPAPRPAFSFARMLMLAQRRFRARQQAAPNSGLKPV